MEIGSFLLEIFNYFVAFFSSPEIRFFPIYIISMVAICFIIYVRSGEKGGFLSWLFPKKMYLHKSHMVDIKLFVFGRFMALFGLINTITFTSLTAVLVMAALGGSSLATSALNPFLVAFLLILVSDFATYWVHRIHHETTPLWPFHSVHHSAEVLTPVTVYRKHPIYDIISSIVHGVCSGLLQGVLLALFVGKIEFTTIAGVNAFVVVFNFVGSNIRHSHVWLSYGRVLEHILISPAQHQIHHSVDKKHWNKNYGEIFAIWDWMFGTLYVPKSKEILQFGISSEPGFEQPHPTLRDALIGPIIASWKALKS